MESLTKTIDGSILQKPFDNIQTLMPQSCYMFFTFMDTWAEAPWKVCFGGSNKPLNNLPRPIHSSCVASCQSLAQNLFSRGASTFNLIYLYNIICCPQPRPPCSITPPWTSRRLQAFFQQSAAFNRGIFLLKMRRMPIYSLPKQSVWVVVPRPLSEEHANSLSVDQPLTKNHCPG